MSGIPNLTLAEAAKLVSQAELSPVELVNSCLERIDSVKQMNAYITVYEEQAKKVAQAAENLVMAGYSLGPLHGIPFALKDNIALKGLRTTAGSKILRDWIPEHDATVASRLKSAGAVIIGKTNLHEFAWGGTSDNPHYGTVKNAWDISKFPAGSSGGSAVAVATRSCFGALGTDTGGSIRLPAAINGVVGIRPTIGRVSNYGIIPLAWSMDTCGPMTRTVEDCALMLNTISGHDALDPGSVVRPVPDFTANLKMGVQGLRIGIVTNYSFKHVQMPVLNAVRNAILALESQGALVVETEIPNIEDSLAAQFIIEAAEPSTYHQKWLRERGDEYGEDVRTLLEAGEMYLATHYIQAQRYRSLLRKEFMDAFRFIDLFIFPSLPFTATPLGATKVTIEGNVEEDILSAITQFTSLASLTGLPALNVPCGFDMDGVPIGMQLLGKPFDEETLLRVGALYQTITNFHEKSPTI